MVLNIAHCRKQTKNNWRALKCGGGSGQRRPVCSVVWEVKKYCIY